MIAPCKNCYRIGELFAGAGGMSLGSHKARFKNHKFIHVWGNDMDGDACRTIEHNLPIPEEQIYCSKVEDLDFGQLPFIDGLAFGIPGNDFSVVGDRRGIAGEYGGLYRWGVEVKTSLKIGLPDQDAEVGPVPTSGGGRKPEPELDQLSNIIKAFNDQFGNIDWKDADKIRKVIAEEIPAKVVAGAAYQNAMKNNNKKTAWIEHDAALQRVMIDLLADHTELFKQFKESLCAMIGYETSPSAR